jgi:tape measure domain-containing protein
MATTFDAILKIAAQVTGTDRIARLSNEMELASSGANRFGRSASGLSGIMAGLGGQLAALASAGALVAFTGSIITAGDEAARLETRIKTLAGPFGEVKQLYATAATAAQRYGLSNQDAASAMADLHSRLRPMGMSFKEVETTFFGLMNATRRAGLSMVDAKAAALQLGQAMGSGRLQGDELRSLLERLPGMADALAKAFNRVAQDRGLELISKDRAARMTEALKEGEKQQVANLKEAVREKERILRGETNDMLREIQRRYDALTTKLDDFYDDTASQQERREEELANQRQESINNAADAQIQAVQRRYEDERRARLSSQENMAEAERVMIERALQDREDQEIEAIRDRAKSLAQTEQRIAEDERKRRSRVLRDQRSLRLGQLQELQRAEEEKIRGNSEKRLEQLKANQEKELATIKAANIKAQAEIVARTAATAGDIKKLGEQGLLSAQVAAKAMGIFSEQKTPPPTGLQLLTKAFEDMRTELGKKFFPMIEEKTPLFLKFLENTKTILIELKPTIQIILIALEKIIEIFNGLVYAFGLLPEPIQKLIGLSVNLRISLGLLSAALSLAFGLTLPQLLTGFAVQTIILLAKLELAFAGLSTWVTATFVPRMIAALSPLLTWMTATFVPMMVAFFSGPAGWITLAIVGIGALLYAFREPITEAVMFAIGEFKKLPRFFQDEAKVFPQKFEEAYTIPIQKALQSSFDNIKKGWNDLIKGLEDRVKQFIGTLSGLAGKAINSGIKDLERKINFLIEGLNRIGSAIPGNSIKIPSLKLPELAEGGYARSQAIVKIAEAGEPEYVIPESKMNRAAINVLQGRTGIDVLSARPAPLAATPSTTPKNIIIEIRPNYVQFNGANFVRESEIPEIITMVVERVHGLMSQPEVQAALRY